MAESSSKAGAAVYSRFTLFVYDLWVLNISNRFAWRCSTTKTQLPFFQENLSSSHLDIGVGTGYYLAHANISEGAQLKLLDLNQNSLNAANERIGGCATTLLHDALTPLPPKEKFDSISMFYLLHCMPGPSKRKVKVFSHLRNNLNDNGVLFGTTILGTGVNHNAFGRLLMSIYNKMGIFDNYGDGEKKITEALNDNFELVDVRVEGVVLIFKASGPRKT